ncbi:MAG: hypothetical protein ACI9HY_002240 [Planctomycetaceae bacterium]|jgi:hypothetical protein
MPLNHAFFRRPENSNQIRSIEMDCSDLEIFEDGIVGLMFITNYLSANDLSAIKENFQENVCGP